MPFFEISNLITMMIAGFILIGITTLFIIPDIFMTTFYLGPKSIKHTKLHQVKPAILFDLAKKPLTMTVFTIALLGLIFLLDPATANFLFTNPLFLALWALAIPATIWFFATKRLLYLDIFYTGLYLKYITTAEKERYNRFITTAEQLSTTEIEQCLKDKNLHFLERSALIKRLNSLQLLKKQTAQNLRRRS